MSPGERFYTVEDVLRVSEVSPRRAQTAWHLLGLGDSARLKDAVAAVVVAYLLLDEQLGPGDKETAARVATALSGGWESDQELFFASGHCELHVRLPETGVLASGATAAFAYGPAEIAERLASER